MNVGKMTGENITLTIGTAGHITLPMFYRSSTEEISGRDCVYAYRNFSDYFRHYAFYAITVFGCLSNLMVVTLLGYSKRMLSSATGIMLLTLTMADTGVIIGEFMSALIYSPEPSHRIKLGNLGCGAISYLKYSSRCVASLVILCISINRFLVVAKPMKFQRFKARKFAVIEMITVVVFSLAASFYGFELTSADCSGCQPNGSKIYNIAIVIVDVVLCDLLSSFAVLVLSFWTVGIFRRFGRQLLMRQDSAASFARQQGERHMTVLLITVALTFVLMRMPYAIVWSLAWFRAISYGKVTHHLINYTHCLSLLNHAINLYLYCVCSRGFRDDLRSMFCLSPTSTVSRSNTVKMTVLRSKSKSISSKSSNDEFKTFTTGVTNGKLY